MGRTLGKPKAFIQIERIAPNRRSIQERVRDWNEVHVSTERKELQNQAARCMDCGVPFCNNGCPLGNLIPEWNHLIFQNRWHDAFDRLYATNNFPEFTGRLCPALCEDSCVLAPSKNSVTVQNIELDIIEKAFKEGWVVPRPPKEETGMHVAIVGSGPSGLACAQQLRRAGHQVTVFERHDRIGGLLTYGIPDFKLEKKNVQRQLRIMEKEGVTFRPNTNVGVDYSVHMLRRDFEAIVLCGGATQPRDLPIPGRELQGIHFAVEYLQMQNQRNAGDVIPEDQFVTARNKRVIILGGGDTGADCLGTALRQGAKTVHQFELLPRPPDVRAPENPWPQWSNIRRSSTAHEEGGIRDYSIQTQSFTGRDDRVERLHAVRLEWLKDSAGRLVPKQILNSEFEMEVDLVLLALGFIGPERNGPLEQLNLNMTERGTLWADEKKMTSTSGVFTAGDMTRGQSLVAWAIAEGRAAARCLDEWLMEDSVVSRSTTYASKRAVLARLRPFALKKEAAYESNQSAFRLKPFMNDP